MCCIFCKADGLSGRSILPARIKAYVRQGEGHRAGHWGGRAIWQRKNAWTLEIAWLVTKSTKAYTGEQAMCAVFELLHGRPPFWVPDYPVQAGARVELPNAQELVAVNLQYAGGAEALNIRAIGQLVAKILYAAGRNVSRTEAEIAHQAADLLSIRKVAPDLVGSGLQYLKKSLGFVKEAGPRWRLSDLGYDAIKKDVLAAAARRAGVVSRHFPAHIDAALLSAWFDDACVAFYGAYGSQWAATLARKVPPKPLSRDAIKALLAAAIARHGLQQKNDILIAGFHSFLASQDREDEAHNWSLCQALLASRLVAANVGPDPITSKEFFKALLLLDTNALIVTALERHRLAHSFAQLGRALKSIDARLGYIEDTRGEYTGVINSKKNAILAAVAKYPVGVLRDSGDPFLDTAIERGCRTQSDIERFVDELLDPPRRLGGYVELEVINDSVTLQLAEAGRLDSKLQSEISKTWQELRGRRKSPRAAEHDAALTNVAEGLRQRGMRCSVLTLDRTMHAHALKRASLAELPQWISLDALIQILALDNAGPTLDASDAAPLMSSIIRHQCEPMLDTYTAEDLALMLDVEVQVAELPPEEVRRVAASVARERLKGRSRNDPELALSVRRLFQRVKLKVTSEAAELAGRLEIREADVRSRDQQLIKQGRVTAAAIGLRAEALRKRAHVVAIATVLGGLAFAIILGWVGLSVISAFVSGFDADWLDLFYTSLGPSAGILWWIVKSVLPTWQRDVTSALSRAEAELYDLANTAPE